MKDYSPHITVFLKKVYIYLILFSHLYDSANIFIHRIYMLSVDATNVLSKEYMSDILMMLLVHNMLPTFQTRTVTFIVVNNKYWAGGLLFECTDQSQCVRNHILRPCKC